MGQRKQITLPDDAAAILQALTVDCGIDNSLVITLLLRRYHSHLRQLFAIDKGIEQPATAPQVVTPPNAVVSRSESLPVAEKPKSQPDKPPPLTGL
ncbi:hypothetical protein H6F51_24730 [Cyanobacteria bacterium FACHB-DQ100]|nr:hypothetical protein [Cyanobacteria bacterium FACHB-DQ100]